MALAEAKTEQKRDRKAIDGVIAALAAQFGNRLVTSQAVREQHGNTMTWIPNQPPDAVVFPQTTEDVQQVVRLCAAARVPVIPFGVGTSLEGPGQRAARRHLARFPRHESRACGSRRRSRLRHRARYHAQSAQRAAPRSGRVLSDRSRRRCVARRHGGDARLGHQRGALRHDEGQRAVVQSRARQRRGDDDGEPGKKIQLRLRSHPADRRIGRHARHHHRADAAARRHSGGDIGRRVSVSVGRGVLQRDDPDDPVRHSGGAHRIARRVAGAGLNMYSKLALPETPMLFLEFHGTEASVAEQSQRFGDIAREFGGGPFDWATRAEDRTRLWQARHDAYCGARRCVPVRARSPATSACRYRGSPNA